MKMQRVPCAVLNAACAIFAALSPAGEPKFDTRLSRQVVTPHTPFAKPYARGAIRALVIAPKRTQRETVELAQRLSLDYAPLMTKTFDDFGPYEKGDERKSYQAFPAKEFRAHVDERLSEGEQYDLIIVGKMKWDAIPEAVRRWMRRRVDSGAGLLYVGPWGKLDEWLNTSLREDGGSLARGLPALDKLPRFKTGIDTPVLRVGAFGRGRLVTIDYGENEKTVHRTKWRRMMECLTPYRSDDPLYYDYWHSLLARAAIWAARWEPDIVFEGSAEPVKMAPERTAIRLRVRGTQRRGENHFLHWTVRGRRGQTECTGVEMWAGGVPSVALPCLKAGEKILDLWLRDRQARVVDWASMALVVQSDLRITEVALDGDVVQKGETLRGTITLSQVLGKGQTVRLDAFDGHSRLVASEEARATGDQECRFALGVEHPLASAYTLRVQLVVGDRTVDEVTREFYINTTDFSELTRYFSFHMWHACLPDTQTGRAWLDEMARCGVDVLYLTEALWEDTETSEKIARLVAQAGLKAAPYACRLFLASHQHGHLKPVERAGGPAIPARRNRLAKSLDELRNDGGMKHLQDLARTYGPLGPVYYSLGDENCLSSPPYIDICFSDQVRASFQKYLKAQYPSLDALNQEWSTDFRDWREVKAITLKDAGKGGKYPQWIDHRRHMDKLFTQLHAVCVEAIREIDPAAKVGIEGLVYPTCSFTGFNLCELGPLCHFYSPYNHIPEIHTWSFLPRESMRGTFFGNYRGSGEGLTRYMPWHMLFEGANSIIWWPSNLGFRPDLLPGLLLRQACEEIGEIKSGIGKLLITAERETHPIAVHYSNSCLHASTVRSVETRWENSLQDFHHVLRDAGYEYRFLSPRDVLAGELAKHRVLILPYAQAISPEEVKAIDSFVKAGGGILIADFAPGIMDEHGKVLGRSSLLDVFGKFERLHIQSYGQGKAVCFADYVKGYSTRRKKGSCPGVCDGLIRLLTQLAGVRPSAAVRDTEANTRQDIEVSQFRSGDASFLALLRVFAGEASKGAGAEGQMAHGMKGSASDSVVIALPKASHVYEVRSHAYVGHQAEIETSFAPGEPKVYALLPTRIDGIRVHLSKGQYRSGQVVTVNGALTPEKLANCGAVARLQVSRGKEVLAHYTANIAFRGGFSHAIPLALNEHEGEYRVTVQDVVSGRTASVAFSVAPMAH